MMMLPLNKKENVIFDFYFKNNMRNVLPACIKDSILYFGGGYYFFKTCVPETFPNGFYELEKFGKNVMLKNLEYTGNLKLGYQQKIIDINFKLISDFDFLSTKFVYGIFEKFNVKFNFSVLNLFIKLRDTKISSIKISDDKIVTFKFDGYENLEMYLKSSD